MGILRLSLIVIMYSIRYWYLDDAIIEMATSTMQMVRSTTELIAHINNVLLALDTHKKNSCIL